MQDAKQNALISQHRIPHEHDSKQLSIAGTGTTTTYTLGIHGQIRALCVSRHWMQLGCILDQIVQLSNRVDVLVVECLDREIAGDGEDNDRVEVVRQEPGSVRAMLSYIMTAGDLRCLDTTDKSIDSHTNGNQKRGCDDVHSGAIQHGQSRPYTTTKNTYTAATTAAAPSSILADAKMLLTRHRIIKTACAILPGSPC